MGTYFLLEASTPIVESMNLHDAVHALPETATSTTFRAAVVRDPGGQAPIELVDVPLSDPGPGEIRVAVRAAPVNPVDLGVASGRFHAMGLIGAHRWTGLGWEFAGVVDAVGPAVDLRVGTRVAGMVPGFDRDVSTYAEQLVVPASNAAVVPPSLDLTAASTIPLNGLAAVQILDLLGTPGEPGNRLLVTGAAGSVGGFLLALAPERGWQVTGWARSGDEAFVRGAGADFTTDPGSDWDAVADAGALQELALALVRDGGSFVGVQPSARPAPQRGIRVEVLVTTVDASTLTGLLARAGDGALPTRIRAVVPLDEAPTAHRLVADGGVRGKYVIQP